MVLLVTIAIFALKAFLPAEEAVDPETADLEAEQAFVSPYNWTNLDRTDGRYRYIVDGEVKSRLGIDVSENQHEIDWQAVADDGIEFAMIRLGYRGATKSDIYVDEQFWNNLEGARSAGIDCGVYFFSQADTVEDATEEAEFVLKQLEGIELQYPIAFDSEVVNIEGAESPTADLTHDEMTAIAEEFCTRMENAGYSAMLYGNAKDLSRYHYTELSHLPVWWAEYGTPAPTARFAMALWQYSNEGQVAGISTVVDMNIDLRGAQ